jgi:dTDP-4-amino-4,6-dideoxygalactose transaminase
VNEAIAFSRPCFGEAEAEAAAAVVRSGWVVGGPRLAEFEGCAARSMQSGYRVGRPGPFSSCTPGVSAPVTR